MALAPDSRVPEVDSVILSEALAVLSLIPDESIDLIYVDPPFGTGQVRSLESISVKAGEGNRRGFAGRSYASVTRSKFAYRDDMTPDEYLRFLEEHLLESRRVLRACGSIYLHLDFHMVHHARLLMDDVFGADHFLNEIIWAYDYGGRRKDIWPRKHDNILWYAKGAEWTFNTEEINRIPYMAPGLVTPDKVERGKLPTDVWWMTIVPTNSRERTGYPTQKPERLLERIIAASSRPGDLVVDFFAGSGTTAVVAKRLGRHYLIVDNNPDAIAIAKQRLTGSNDLQQTLGIQ